jgi:hypothetical protein
MGLDATVYCNCFETGKLREPAPLPDLVYVTPNGFLECQSDDLTLLLSFDQWLCDRACIHKDGILLTHRIGNIDLVGKIRMELSIHAEKFPILLSKVVYSGTHAGDFLPNDKVVGLEMELRVLGKALPISGDVKEYIKFFRSQMSELVKAAQSVSKPIAF